MPPPPTKTWLYQRHRPHCPAKPGTRCTCPWWIRGTINSKPIRESLQTERLDIAVERQRRLEQGSVADPAPPPASPPATPSPVAPAETETHRLDQLIETFIRHRLSGGKIVESTAVQYRSVFKKFQDYARSRRATTVEALTLPLVDDFVMAYGTYKPRSRFKHYRFLKVLFKWAARRVGRPHLVAELLSEEAPSRPTDGAHRPLARSEQSQILAACDRTRPEWRARERAAMLTLLSTGLRSIDTRNLIWPNFDFQKRTLTVLMQKTRRHRTHPLVIPNLPPVLIDALRALPRSTDPNARVFPEATAKQFKGMLKAIAKRSAVRFTAHDCRVTFAVERLAGGAQIWDVSQLLGHSSTAITERYYIKWVRGLDQRLAAVMENADFSHLERTGS